MLFALLSITLRPVTARSLAGSAAAGVIDAQLPTWSAHPVNQTALPMTHSSIDPLKPHAACGNATTFVTFITGARYATAASCLPQMLRNVGSRCPLLLIYNDADTELPLSRLKQAYGKGQMVPLSHLKAHYYEWSRSLRQAQAPASGRRLFSTHAEMLNTHLKLWVWALPTEYRVVYLDIDIIILRNIDALLNVVPPTLPDGYPGLGAVTCKSKYGERFFNSGIMVLTPSLRTLQRLMHFARFASAPWNGVIPYYRDQWPDICAPRDDPFAAKRLFPNTTQYLAACRKQYGPGGTPHRMIKACESKLGDQSILNAIFKSHAILPRGFNIVNMHLGDLDANSSKIFHFVGEPKPWSPDAFQKGRNRNKDPARRNMAVRWQTTCAAV